MHTRTSPLLAATLLGALAATTARADVAEGFTETTVLAGLTAPTAIAFLPDGRMVIAEMDGSLLLADLAAEGVIVPVTLAEVPVAFCNSFDFETGLLGLAVDPAFAENGFLYLYRTFTELDPCTFDAADGRINEVIRVTLTDPAEGAPTVDLGSLTVLLTDIRAPLPYHVGGGLRVGLDDTLFVSTGDTYTGDDPDDIGPGESTNPFAQDLTALEGKLLRIGLDGSIPQDNPFVGAGGGVREEIFASGFRNPWRFGIDEQTGAVWLGDVGQVTIEELDVVVPGGNYGWPRCEGKLPGGCKEPGDVQPVFTYPHTGAGALGGGVEGATIIGGAFAPGQFDYQGGIYFFGEFEGHAIFSVPLNGQRTKLKGKPAAFATDVGLPVDIVFGPDHALYFASIDGRVVRIAPPPSGGQQPLLGSSLVLKDGAKKSLKLLGKDVVVLGGGEDNPTLAGGTLRVVGTSLLEGGTLFDDTYALPAKGWKLLGKAPDKVTGFKYADGKLENGPITSVSVKAGKQIKLAGKGDGLLHTLATEPAVVQIVLTLGTRSFCLAFDEPDQFTADTLFKSTDEAAPLACP